MDKSETPEIMQLRKERDEAANNAAAYRARIARADVLLARVHRLAEPEGLTVSGDLERCVERYLGDSAEDIAKNAADAEAVVARVRALEDAQGRDARIKRNLRERLKAAQERIRDALEHLADGDHKAATYALQGQDWTNEYEPTTQSAADVIGGAA